MESRGSYILPDNVRATNSLHSKETNLHFRNWAVWLQNTGGLPRQKEYSLRTDANAPETKDNDFTWKDFQARNNNELVAVYGNFVNRAMVLTQKYFDGRVPAQGELTDYDKETLKEFADVKAEVEKLLDVFKFRDAQKEAMNLARIGNKYLADTERETGKNRYGACRYHLNISCNWLQPSILSTVPAFSSEKLRKMLNMSTFEWLTGVTNFCCSHH
jgi:methionyl-tRNA synthetase